jgi:hypothetical protein
MILTEDTDTHTHTHNYSENQSSSEHDDAVGRFVVAAMQWL